MKLPDAVKEMIGSALWSVCKTIYEEEERREKNATRQENKDRSGRERGTGRRTPEGDRVSRPAGIDQLCDRQWPVSVSEHNLYYAVRKMIQKYTSAKLKPEYFSQTLLTEYQEIYGKIENLYYDPRGAVRASYQKSSGFGHQGSETVRLPGMDIR